MVQVWKPVNWVINQNDIDFFLTQKEKKLDICSLIDKYLQMI